MMNPNHTRSLTLFAIMSVTLASVALGQTMPADAPQDLDAFAARVLKEFEVPGLAVAIVKDGKVVLAKGYGVRKLGEPTPVDENTLFGRRQDHLGRSGRLITSGKKSYAGGDGETVKDYRSGRVACPRSRLKARYPS